MKNRFVLYLSMFISFLCSMNVWFSWNDNKRYIDFLLSIIIVACVIFGRVKLVTSRRNKIACLLLTIAYLGYGIVFVNYKSFVISVSTLLTYYIIICLNIKDKKNCLEFITKWFTFMMIPSFICWLINWVVPLPSFGSLKLDNGMYGLYYNHLIFIEPTQLGYMFRFCGPFLEPGHLGMMTAFLIYANRFNLKDWRLVAIAFIMLFTWSLAGYVLFAMGYCFNKLIIDKDFIKKMIIAGIIALGGAYIAMNYNKGYNFINELIVARLEYDEAKGFAGNNRVFGEIDDYYDYLFRDSKYFWHGYSRKTIKDLSDTGSRGTGYVMFVVMYGFLGLILTSLFYIYYARTSKCKKYALMYLIFVCAVFWQRCYPFWTSWLICYAWGLSIYDELNYVPSQNKKTLAPKREINKDEQTAIPVTE